MISRRKLLSGVAAAAAFSALGPVPTKASSGVIAGAIRWDPWYDVSETSAQQAQYFLGPQKWQFRAPWFCNVISDQLISCAGTQAIIDSEITYAATAGLKYWAFDQYLSTSAFTAAWNLYQSSSLKNSINWCWFTQFSVMGSTGNYSTQVSGWVANFQQANYQLVLTNRPLFYILWDNGQFASNWGGLYSNLAAMITALRAATIAVGLGTPYIVVVSGSVGNASLNQSGANIYAANIGADAISFYTKSGTGSYASLVSATEATWASFGATGTPIIPCAVMGWDTRPQLQRPATYTGNPYAYQSKPVPNVGLSQFTTPGTVTERANHIQDAVTYINAHPTICPSTVLLINGWTENSEEGGQLIPTIGDPPVGNTNNILSAIAPIIT